MQYKQAADGKELDGGMGYSQNGGSADAGGYSMGGGSSPYEGGMSYSMGGDTSSKEGGMDSPEANEEGRIKEDGYTQSGK